MVKKTAKKITKKPKQSVNKVDDFEPTKMSLAVATTASVSLVVLAVLATTV